MEREILLTGIGGQGVQLAAQVLARAAVAEGRDVMSLGTYGGTMRGGNTDSTVVVADEPIAAPPIVSRAWSAMAMHHQFWEPTGAKIREGGVVVVNSTLFEAALDTSRQRVFEVPATRIAGELGSALGASLVLLGAYVKLTGIVSVDALCEAMAESLPAYRLQHLESNRDALRAGYAAVEACLAPAWGSEGDDA